MAYDPLRDKSVREAYEYAREMIARERDFARRQAEDYIRRYIGSQQMPWQFPIQSGSTGAMPLAEIPNPKPLAEEQIVGVVTGFRCWNAPLFEDVLRSQRGTKWIPRQKLEAVCSASICAAEKCSCGIYAYKELSQVESEYGKAAATKKNVYGQVYLWGRVLDCERGYRAQFAYPKAFLDTGSIARRMAEVYGVPLLTEGK